MKQKWICSRRVAKFAATAGMNLKEFRDQFEYLIAYEPPRQPLVRADLALQARRDRARPQIVTPDTRLLTPDSRLLTTD